MTDSGAGEIMAQTGKREEMTGEEILLPGERLDDLQRNGYRIIQDPGRFCFGMDAVLLSGFAQVKKGQRVIDLGTGTGIIPILLSAKSEGSYFAGLELQQESADMAGRSVRLNGLQDRVEIICGDIKEADRLFKPSSFDVVTCNPPYMIAEHGLKNANTPKLIARHEVCVEFEDVARAAARLLKTGGKLYLVHRPFRLAELFATLMKHSLEPKRMQLVYPYVDREPNMVLIEACLGGRSRMSVEKPLIIYDKDGRYMQEIYDIYGY